MNDTFLPLIDEVILWTPNPGYLGSNGETIDEMMQIETALELNEIARQDGGHVQAWLNDFSYLKGCAEEEGFW